MKYLMTGAWGFITFTLITCSSAKTPLSVSLRISDSIDFKNVVASYSDYDKGGNTSVDNDEKIVLKWSGDSINPADWGYYNSEGEEIPYFKRNRDLGQTFLFNGSETQKLTAVIVRLGFGSNVIRTDMYGKKISLQFFEVSGRQVLHTNGTESSQQAFHGFPHDRVNSEIPHERDDYLTGENYESLAVISGYEFPQKTDFGFSSNEIYIPPDTSVIKGKFLEFIIPENIRIRLRPGKKYAFLLMIDSAGTNRGFTLANNYTGKYSEGHGIRREGKGIFPPVPATLSKNQEVDLNNDALISARFPGKIEDRIKISPGTNGYPDVDTWRDFVFYIRAE